jgi:hypothetical protein
MRHGTYGRAEVLAAVHDDKALRHALDVAAVMVACPARDAVASHESHGPHGPLRVGAGERNAWGASKRASPPVRAGDTGSLARTGEGTL